MLLAIDVGNTNTVLGLFRGERLAHSWRVQTNPRATGDEMLLVTALHNLISNAIQYSPDGSRVGIGVNLSDGIVEIAVTGRPAFGAYTARKWCASKATSPGRSRNGGRWRETTFRR